jgi:septal ring factor EnvC (AmiA/AmiB activator)
MPPLEVLPECTAGFTDVRIAVASIEKDIIQHAKVADKLAEAVQKIQEMNANLCRMISLHELKHDSAEKAHDDIEDELKILNVRIDKLLTSKRAIESQNIKGFKQEEVNAALDEFKKWKYIITGAAVVIGYLLAHAQFNWSFLLNLISFHGQ